jgi:5'-deoxynucleotidase YfbR-like HD superfamily hydrolase
MSLTNFFKILQLSRVQPQNGYQPAVRSKGEVSDLAQHHYLVTMLAWQLARASSKTGAKVNVERVLELALLHDIGELFGGDINFYYARSRPKVREAAKAFQKETEQYLTDFFGNDKEYMGKLFEENAKKETNEAIIARIADHLECLYYKSFAGVVGTQQKDALAILKQNCKRAPDKRVAKVLANFVIETEKALKDNDLESIIWKGHQNLVD